MYMLTMIMTSQPAGFVASVNIANTQFYSDRKHDDWRSKILQVSLVFVSVCVYNLHSFLSITMVAELACNNRAPC